MNKEESLSIFYSRNNINPTLVADYNSAEYDERLLELVSRIDLWLSNIDSNDRETFLEVLSEFTYLSQTSCQIRFREIVELLKIELQNNNIQINEVLFVTVESPDGTKSGSEHVCADFYMRNRSNNIVKNQIVSSYSKYDSSELLNYKAIVFLDDIVGSGFTLWKTINEFLNRLSVDKDSLCFYCSCLIATKRGVRLINRNSKKNNLAISWLLRDEWYSEHAFKKGSKQYEIFKKYEKQIDDYIHIATPDKNFFMGFYEAALSVAFHYNTPNNTLSTFWCETDSSNPIFKRDGNQPTKRLAVKDLKHKKRITNRNSYLAAIERN